MQHERAYIFKNTVSQKNGESAKVQFSSLERMEIEPAAEFGGGGKAMNPEEMFVAAINGCLMNTFFYFVRKFKIEFLSYNSLAEGRLEKQSDGFRFISVKVRARIALSEIESFEKVHEAGRLAEKYCLVSRSVACPVDYKLEIESKE
ncbi:MAG: OsmC family protein [Sedimentisphaerales bacterium]|nr:OsmC family protein [Sedimentisphaerales bacterium]